MASTAEGFDSAWEHLGAALVPLPVPVSLSGSLAGGRTADALSELYRDLVLIPPTNNTATDFYEPWWLFRHFHAGQPDGAVTTALLLLTHRRWRKAAGPLVRQMAASGILSEEALDHLADVFLAAGPCLYWEAPAEWFTAPEMLVDADGARMQPLDGPVLVARHVRRPVRRWAAERRLRADPTGWGMLLARARELDAKPGAAIVRGMLDGIDALAPTAREALLARAGEWPHRRVRDATKKLIRRRP